MVLQIFFVKRRNETQAKISLNNNYFTTKQKQSVQKTIAQRGYSVKSAFSIAVKPYSALIVDI
jgi:hypothetical protein